MSAAYHGTFGRGTQEGGEPADCWLVGFRGNGRLPFRCRAGERLVEIERRASPAETRFPLSRLQHRILLSTVAVCALCAAHTARASPAERQALRSAVDALLSQPPLTGAR